MEPITNRHLVLGALAMVALSALAFLLPTIALSTGFADYVVRLTDTAVWQGLPWILAITLLVFMGRPGLGTRRRAVEIGVVLVGIVIGGLLITLINERTIKPAFAIPRPNLVALAESGQLGAAFPTAEELYDVGDKEDRREVLAVLLPEVTSPELSDAVRDHWAYEAGYSFPSGHTMAAATFASAVSLLAAAWLTGRRRTATLLALPIWAVLIAYSRVLLEVHRPIDVIAGTALGILFGSALASIIKPLVGQLAPNDARHPE